MEEVMNFKSRKSVSTAKLNLTYTVGLSALLALGGGLPAFAQEDEPAATVETTDGEARQQTITVTGSRIPTDPNLASSVPVQSITGDDIRLSGEINLAEVVSSIPALISSLTAENSATGANQLNLRGLGTARTLTMVNGRRHVAGFRGSQSVDVGTIPRALVERVDVTTGGASAVYGADAVTGVVNFILKDDFEGIQLDARGGMSRHGDAENFAIDALFGRNFDNGRGNVILSLSYEDDSAITYGERSWSRDNGIASIGPRANPDTSPGAPPRAVINDARFWLTSNEGSIAPGFGGRNIDVVDINNNGIPDCQESQGGRVGFLAGCWLTNPDGTVRVNQDGIILNGLWGIGGDGGRLNFNRDYLYPETDRFVGNLNAKYELADNFSVFFEGKYVRGESRTFSEQDTFFDTLFILPDNAFIPDQLQPVVDVTGGLLLSKDPLDFSDNNPFTYTRETIRFVGGFEWQPAEGHNVEVSFNHGTFKNKSETTSLYLDRVFAAMDSVIVNGQAVCRSDIDPTAFYEIDYFAGGNGFADGAFASNRYYSFTPGDGQCKPLNPFGLYAASAAAQNFVTANIETNLTIEQTVFSAISSGEFGFLDRFMDGSLGYAFGVEYRKESSDNRLDPLTLGILPEGTSFTPGINVNEVDDFLFSFTSFDNTQQFDTSGSYDVYDVFAEVRLPLLQDRPFAKDLTVDGAIRVSDYSTLGETTTWKIGGTYAPVEDLTFRATLSEAVRAPNISELFDPRLPIFVNATEEPCDVNAVGLGTANRQANCVASLQAAGVPLAQIVDGGGNYIWSNPLTARFSGVSGGNPDLGVETADTFTIGAVFTPRFLDGFFLTVDYWDVKIDDAISAVGARDILVGCLDSGNFPNVGFCDQFSRRSDGGLNFLESGQINFASIEASGYDFAVGYRFDVGENSFGARLVGTRQEKLNRFFNPTDPGDIDPELEEIQFPKLSGNLSLSWDRGPLSLGFKTSYQSRQSVDEIEDVLGLYGKQPLYGDAGFFDETYIHDANFGYRFSDSLTFYGGVNNIGDEKPFATQTAWPVGPRGRFFFLGATYRR